MTPEEKARKKIDQWFADAGWEVVNRDDYEPTCTAVAIREGLLKGNLEADYFLFINGKAVGVLENRRICFHSMRASNLIRKKCSEYLSNISKAIAFYLYLEWQGTILL